MERTPRLPLFHNVEVEMVTLGTIKEATSTEAITRFVQDNVLTGSDWNLVKVKRKSIRLEPPHAYWTTFRVVVGRGDLLPPDDPGEAPVDSSAESAAASMPAEPSERDTAESAAGAEAEPGEPIDPPDLRYSEERELRLVARGVFDPAQWVEYRDRILRMYGTKPCRPLEGLGYPQVFDETQHAIWFYPVDPNLRGLDAISDPLLMRRYFRNNKERMLDRPGSITAVRIELARYLPEIAAITRYDIEAIPAGASKTIFGKSQNGDRGAESDRIGNQMWRLAEASGGRLRVPRPLGYERAEGIYFQDSVPGEALGTDRTAPEFLPGVLHAAEALALIHDSGIETHKKFGLDGEINRLDRVLDQFAIVHPRGYFLLRELLVHIRSKLRGLKEEETVPSHGDFKYDQFLHHEGTYSLIDFDYFAATETSFDLGKFCGHLMPSMPKDWQQAYAADQARTAFIHRYRELRPRATLQRFPIYETTNLAGRAMTLMWGQGRGWKQSAEAMLVLAMERLRSKVP